MAELKASNYSHIRQLNWRHGLYQHPAYNSWLGMMQRCFNPKATKYPKYGACGITVCERWLDINNFIKDMGERLSGYTIERKNNKGNYEPDNCYWAPMSVQALNKSSNHIIDFDGKSQTLKEWATELGMKYSTLATRLMCYHWSIERALTEAVHPRQSRNR